MPSVLLSVRESSFILKLLSTGDSLIIARKSPFTCELRDPSWRPSSDEFLVDSVEVAAVFGALEIEEYMYLVFAREADLAAEVDGERFWNLKRVEFIDFFGNGAMMTSFAVGNARSFLSSGLFYFSDSARLLNGERNFDWGSGMRSLYWESETKFFTALVHGYVGQRRLFGTSGPLLLTLFARRSVRRPGTRFSARGINDEGDVGNFVETELLVSEEISDAIVFRHVQVRGSVPLFWQQRASNHVPELTRRSPFMRRAFARHMDSLRRKYGEVIVLDLLSRSKEGERLLSEEYGRQARSAGVEYVHFDFNANVADSGGGLLEALTPLLAGDIVSRLKFDGPAGSQLGVIRTSCLDCLDRTNAVQLILAFEALSLFLGERSPSIPEELLELFVELGDAVSLANAGAGSVFSRYLRSAGTDRLGSFIQQTYRGAERLWAHHFESEDRDIAIATVLKKFLPSEAPCSAPMLDSTAQTLTVGALTFNINGKKIWEDETLETVLAPLRSSDVISVGLQELVKLDISGFLLNFREGDRAEALERRCRELLRTTHVAMEHTTMVGLDLAVYVRKSLVAEVTHVDKFDVKTAAGGSTGNKGGVGVRFRIGDNFFTIINIHLDAGDFKHQERAQALTAVLSGLSPTEESGNVVILGDFNFRLNLVNGDTQKILRTLASGGHYELFRDFDEGNISANLHKFRKMFTEGKINFLPTYKYVNFSKNYTLDRTPAWCDRVYFKAQLQGECALYEALANVTVSDHKPVIALLNFTVQKWHSSVASRPEPADHQAERDWVVVRHNYLD